MNIAEGEEDFLIRACTTASPDSAENTHTDTFHYKSWALGLLRWVRGLRRRINWSVTSTSARRRQHKRWNSQRSRWPKQKHTSPVKKGKTKKLSAHLNFSQKINFCPFYSWVIVSVNSANPRGGGAGAVQRRAGGFAAIYCSRPWSLAPLLLSARWFSISGKQAPVSHPYFHQVAGLLHHDPVSEQWCCDWLISLGGTTPLFFRKYTKKERKHERAVMLFLSRCLFLRTMSRALF